MHGYVRNAAGDGCRMPGDQAEEVRPRKADESGKQHRDRHAGVELAVAGRGGDKRMGRSSGGSHAAKDISTVRPATLHNQMPRQPTQAPIEK